MKKSKLKKRGYFDQRNQIEKVGGNEEDFTTIEITSKNVRANKY